MTAGLFGSYAVLKRQALAARAKRTTEIAELIKAGKSAPVLTGLSLRVLSAEVINICPSTRELVKADVDLVRAALIEAGYVEVESWIAREGRNWLNDGVRSVSFKIAKAS